MRTHEKAEKERINRQTETIPPEKKVEFVSSANTRYQVSRDTMQRQQSIEIGLKMSDDRFMLTAVGLWNFYLMVA